ncbi:hypothetical protein MBLNU457_6610t1 [Dothideomycetes sp. NU457]
MAPFTQTWLLFSCCILAACNAASTTCKAKSAQKLDLVRYGSFTQTATYSIANQLGFFTAYGLDVQYLQTPNSTYAYNTTLSGGYDIFTGAIDNCINLRFNQGRNVTVLGQLDGGADQVIASVPSIKTIADLKGKSLMVDSPVSGFAYALRKVLSLYGLELGTDYTFVTVGGTSLRYADLVNGTFNGSAAYGSILAYPFTAYGEALPDGKALNILARISDFVAPYTSDVFTIAEDTLTNTTVRNITTRFIAAMHDANTYLASTKPHDQNCSIRALAAQYNISTALAQTEYVAATNTLSGEITTGQMGNFTVDRIGLLNVIDIRNQYNGFGSVPKGFDFVEAIEPGTGKLIDYSILEAALAISKKYKPTC